MHSDEQQILKLFEDGERALMAADLAELSRIYADDYIQYDESGNVATKADVINNLSSGKIRFVSMVSTGRHIRLLRDDVAIVHGSEDDVVEQGSKRFPVRYLHMGVVVKRGERWQIVGSQLATPTEIHDNFEFCRCSCQSCQISDAICVYRSGEPAVP
jgi:uncharacterized protein (TIGR02246 family)